MILSFSVPEMLPYIRAGLKRRAGEPHDMRVKRQTIRRRGPRAERLLDWAGTASWTIPYDLHLWWKSRTPERELIGVVGGELPIYAYPLSILHSRVIPPTGAEYPILRIDGPTGWRRGDPMLFWSEGSPAPDFVAEVFADGFDSVEAFRDFFVPNMGDHFEGVIYKW